MHVKSSEAKQTIGTTLPVTAAACTWTTAAMLVQQKAGWQQGEGVRAADATDGPVAIGPR